MPKKQNRTSIQSTKGPATKDARLQTNIEWRKKGRGDYTKILNKERQEMEGGCPYGRAQHRHWKALLLVGLFSTQNNLLHVVPATKYTQLVMKSKDVL